MVAYNENQCCPNTEQPHLTHPKYRADIDGLRAIAVLSVIGFHAFPKWIGSGFIGVDIFFVISGFLISSIIFGNLESNSFSYAEFYARRIKRIFPALILVLAASFLFGWFVLLADEYKQLGKHIVAGAGFFSNIALWSEAGYFDNAADTKPLLHLWTLGIEEQFYIVWPLLLGLVWKRRHNFLTITLLIATLSFAINIYTVSSAPVAAFYSPLSRFWELMIGGILAYIALHKPQYLSPKPDWQSAAGLLLIVAGLLLIGEESEFPGWWALLPTTGTFLMISAGPSAWLNHRLLGSRVLVWIGLISYPLYLWHWPLLSFAQIIKSRTPANETRVIAVLLSIVLAWLTYKLIELPIRFGKPVKLKVLVLCLLMLVTGCAGLYAYMRDGMDFRFKQDQSLTGNADTHQLPYLGNGQVFGKPEPRTNEACLKAIPSLSIAYCLASDSKVRPTIALIGDSHANAMYESIAFQFTQKGFNTIMAGQAACPPFLGVERDSRGCPQVMSDIISYIVASNNIKHVLITGRFAATLSGKDFGEETQEGFYSLRLIDDPSITDRPYIFRVGLKKVLDKLKNANKQVVILLDIPELDFDPKSCLDFRDGGSCTIRREVVDERQKDYEKLIRNISKEYDNVKIYDLKDDFCDKLLCYAKIEGHILYRDNHHLGKNGNIFLSNRGINLPLPLNLKQQNATTSE